MEEYKSLIKYIKICHLNNFVEDLTSVYEDEVPLSAYKHLLSEIDILGEEVNDILLSFESSLNGKHRAKLCDGAYINIPKFLDKKDQNYDKIKNYLYSLSRLFKNVPEESKEFIFLNKYFKKLTDDSHKEEYAKQIEGFTPQIDPTTSQPSTSTQRKVWQIFEKFKPEFSDIWTEFQQKKISKEKFGKMILIVIYENVKNIDIADKETILNLIKILVNTPLNKIRSKRQEILSEVKQIDTFKNHMFIDALLKIF